jgi:ABC-type nickel/cobalt efflux system permease component RcnA
VRRRLAALALLLSPAFAAAHPLGNFSVNRWAGLEVAPGTLALRYVVDMAEIPAFQESRVIDRNRDGTLDEAERMAYLDATAAALGAGLAATLEGAPLALVAGTRTLELPPGAGGLPTLRIEIAFAARLPAAAGRVEFIDRNFAGRPGWQEVVARRADGGPLAGATVPAADRSRALRAYPRDLLESPPRVSAARFSLDGPADVGRGGHPGVPAPAAAGPLGDRLATLMATEAPLGPRLVLGSLLLAVALGAFHALGPGHGKTIVGAYLVGARGSARHALLLGLVVTATHTLGVYLLGLVTLGASRWIVPERLFPWASLASGLLVHAIGGTLLLSRLASALDHDHHHRHHHHHHHDAAHVPAAATAPGWRGLVALGVSGGLVPCPSALVVMLGAIALGRIGFGLVLIVAFSVGLAAVLVAVGLAFVYARRLLERVPLEAPLLRYAPVAGALVVSAAGLAIVTRALIEIGA